MRTNQAVNVKPRYTPSLDAQFKALTLILGSNTTVQDLKKKPVVVAAGDRSGNHVYD